MSPHGLMNAPLARTLLDLPVVMFRNAEGTASALLDRCPHRFAPLSSGTITDGALVCPYHGLGFAGTGRCVLNPHGPITSSMSARAFPLVETYRALWIWMGDPAQADPAMIPDLSIVDHCPETAFSTTVAFDVKI
jgi:phenylpropionate dioxygenase-like ring-hydroxylating dioxygenase large terminal subunit